jgi:cytochrome c biogenesis protein CcmG, thiol:disulfide interchange protein DsbE
MTKRLLATSAVVLLVLGTLGGCETKKAPATSGTTGAPAESSEIDGPTLPGIVLPNASLADLHTGELVSVAETGGRVVLLDFWATWCAPCMKSLPVYEALQTELGPSGLAVVAVSVDVEGAPVAEYAARLAPSVQVLLDPDGAVPKALDLPGLPVAFLVGRDGVVRSRHVGFHTADITAFKAEIEALLAEPVP